MKLHILHVSAIVYISAQLACSPRYAPRTTGQWVLTRDAYVKDGTAQSRARDLLRMNLKALVEDDATSLSYARVAHQNQVAGLACDVAAIVTGILGFGLAIAEDEHFNDVAAQVLVSTSLLATIAGPFFHSRVADNEVDALNAYNDRAKKPTSSEVPMTPPGRLGPVLPAAMGPPESLSDDPQPHTEEQP
jgi:hypothetical protein